MQTNIKKIIEFEGRTYEKSPEKIKLFSRMLKDRMYEKVADAVANIEFLSKNLVLHGGGALYLAYDSPRRTFDMDFSFYPRFDKEKIKKIEECFLKIKPKITKKRVDVRINRISEEEFRIAYYLEIDKALIPTIKVEGKVGKVFLPPKNIMISLTGNLQVEQPKELLADKILAIFGRLNQRGSIKTTDLYDIFYLLQIFVEKMELSFIKEKLKDQYWRVPELEKWPKLYNKIVQIVKNSEYKIQSSLRSQLKKEYFEFLSFDKMLRISIEFIKSLVEQI
ncbi:MAG: nucleotidyl transferase AbiEii/AbiGii toxin family protein [Candidatus Anstonellaceae archaeon]